MLPTLVSGSFRKMLLTVDSDPSSSVAFKSGEAPRSSLPG
jgi:hypothetical protein